MVQIYLIQRFVIFLLGHTVFFKVYSAFVKVIGIGNKKCSSGALMQYLCAHPQMVCPHSEVHFFDNDTAYQQGTEYYRYSLIQMHTICFYIVISKNQK